MLGIDGRICDNPEELKRLAAEKRRAHVEQTVTAEELPTLLQRGWEVVRRNKSGTVRVRKAKPPGQRFEDRVWLLFYKLGFQEMSVDRNCRIRANGPGKQVDVLARDPEKHNIFVVECRTRENEAPIPVIRTLRELSGAADDFRRALQAHWGRRCGRINLLVVIDSATKRPSDERFVQDHRDKNILLWSRGDLEYAEKLANQLGALAMYQLYSIILGDKEVKPLRRSYPALKGTMGSHKFYSFLIPAKELVQYAYVHHRSLTEIARAAQAYQRMLKRTKLRNIEQYLSEENRYFPNSIIVNFSESLRWDQIKAFGEGGMAIGAIVLPGRYGCAWVIDGQHRLYGAARLERDVPLQVIAFENLNQAEQARLFVDINHRQTSVPATLLWDLYSDIYRDDPENQTDFHVAETAKIMAREGPLAQRIAFESLGVSGGKGILSPTTVCESLKHVAPWARLRDSDHPARTPQRAAGIVNVYLEAIRKLWPEQWNAEQARWVLTNAGFQILAMVLRDIVWYWDLTGREYLLSPSKRTELLQEFVRMLRPVARKMDSDPGERQNIIDQVRRATGRGPRSDVAGYLDIMIREEFDDFVPARTHGLRTAGTYQTLSRHPDPDGVADKAAEAERKLRGFVVDSLVRYYGPSAWWKRGLPQGVKQKLIERWRRDAEHNPSLRRVSDQPRRQFDHTDLGLLKDIIVYGANWPEIFQDVFGVKQNLDTRIRQIKMLRDPRFHRRELDPDDAQMRLHDAVAGLHWLATQLADPELRPEL